LCKQSAEQRIVGDAPDINDPLPDDKPAGGAAAAPVDESAVQFLSSMVRVDGCTVCLEADAELPLLVRASRRTLADWPCAKLRATLIARWTGCSATQMISIAC